MGATSLRARVALLAVVGAVAIALLAGIVWSAFADARRVGSDVTTVLSPAAELSQALGVAYGEVDRRVLGLEAAEVAGVRHLRGGAGGPGGGGEKDGEEGERGAHGAGSY